MNKTVLKDIFREIRKNLGRFFSIMALLLISILAFSGVFMATKLLELTPEHYYKEANMHDVLITSTLGLGEKDKYLIANNPLVDDFEMLKFVDVLDGANNEIVRLENLSQRITRPILVEGRLPETGDEIALSYQQFKDLVNLGDTISFVDVEGDEDIKGLRSNKFKVTGLVNSVEHISELSTELTSIGSGTIWSYGYILDENFDMDYYTKAKIKGIDLNQFNSYDQAYEDGVEALIASLEADFKDRPRVRLDEFKEELKKEIKEAEEKLQDAKDQLAEAKEELDEGKIKLLDGKVELEQGKVDLLKARKKLDDGWESYHQGLRDLEKGKLEGEKKLADGKIKLDKSKIELADGRAELEKARIKLEDGRVELDKAKADLKKGEDLYLENLKKVEDGKKELEKQKEKIKISKEIKYGDLSHYKSKEEITSAISDLNSQIAKHKENLENYKAQLAYNEEILETDLERDLVEKKILDLKGLIATEENALNEKSNKLAALNKDLENFKEVEKEGPAKDEVIKYGDEAIEGAEKKLAQGQAELDKAKEDLDAGRKKLNVAIEEFEAGEKKFKDNEQKLLDGEKAYKQGLIDYEKGKETLAKELADVRKKLNDAKADLEQGEKDLVQGQKDLDQGWIDYEKAKADYQSGLKEYNKEEKDARKKIDKGEKEITEAKDNIVKLKAPTFMIDSRKADQMYYMVNSFPGSLKILALVFSILCLSVAVLVASTTMTRMVDERRILIGTFKGLGYENKIIALKFVIFGTVSGLAGSVLGNFVGQKIIAQLIYEIYMGNMFYSEGLKITSPSLLLIAIILAIITTSLSAYLAVNKTLKENTASLLRPKAPKMGKKLVIEKITPIWKRLSFMNKITARNIFRYKGRMLMTITGVAVCMALMILGFGMKNAMQNIVSIQFGDLVHYDLTLVLKDDLDSNDLKVTEGFVDSHENVKDRLGISIDSLKLPVKSGYTQDVNLIVDLEENLDSLVKLVDYKSDKVLDLDDSGVFLTEKIAKLAGVKPGDYIILEIDGADVEVKVSAIVKNYLAHYIYASPVYMEKVSKKNFVVNAILLDLYENDAESIDDLSKTLLENENIISSISTKNSSEILDNTLNSLDLIIVIIVVVSMLLALVVLYNLTNINVSERIRELSTMKVLGFYNGELTQYVYKETFVLSLIGIFLGMGLGRAIVEFILAAFAPDNILFGDPAYPSTFLISSVFTIFFTLIVMVLMHIKLKSIDMIEALKSVD